MGGAEIESFLTDLAVRRHVCASTQNQALNALVFVYREVLHQDAGEFNAVRAKRPTRLPTVLTRAEVQRLFTAIRPGTHRLMARLLYGSGMRLMECLWLRVTHVMQQPGLARHRLTNGKSLANDFYSAAMAIRNGAGHTSGQGGEITAFFLAQKSGEQFDGFSLPRMVTHPNLRVGLRY